MVFAPILARYAVNSGGGAFWWPDLWSVSWPCAGGVGVRPAQLWRGPPPRRDRRRRVRRGRAGTVAAATSGDRRRPCRCERPRSRRRHSSDMRGVSGSDRWLLRLHRWAFVLLAGLYALAGSCASSSCRGCRHSRFHSLACRLPGCRRARSDARLPALVDHVVRAYRSVCRNLPSLLATRRRRRSR